MKIYHNPRCSKSREALSLIQEQGLEPEVIEYLKTPPSASELKHLIELLKLRPRDIMRTKDANFEALALNLDDDSAVIQALVEHPELIERPIVVQGSKAIVARPPERVRELF
jgi:arsenate reductase